jgi:predicted transcriptional regulator
MKRMTLRLPDDLATGLHGEAAHRGMTVSQLIREAIEAHLCHGRRLRAAGAGRSGDDDVSERIEELLAGETAP